MNFAKEIIRRAFLEGYECRVDDGDGVPRRYEDFLQTWEAVTSVCEAQVYINTERRTERMYVVNSVKPEETAADFSGDGFIEAVWDEL